MVRYERHAGTVVWTIERLNARNAIDESVLRGLELAVDSAESDFSIRCAVLTGAGDKAFVSGADLKTLRDLPHEERARLDLRMDALLERIECLPIPVIAVLNGVAIGGGAEVALACDLRIAEMHASITFKHAAMGVTPGWGGLTRLTSIVSRSTAARLLFTAEAMASHEAARVGLVDEVVPMHTGMTRALAMGEAIAKTSGSAVLDLKRLLRGARGKSREDARREERLTFLERVQGADHQEALSAHFDKRPPHFLPRSR